MVEEAFKLLQIPQQRFHSLIVVDVFPFSSFQFEFGRRRHSRRFGERRQIKIDFSEQTIC